LHLVQFESKTLEQALHKQDIDIAISRSPYTGFTSDLLLRVDYVPVAAHNHPLVHIGKPLTRDDFNKELEVVYGRLQSMEEEQGNGNRRRWHVTNVDSAIKLMLNGFGYCWLPKSLVQGLLEKGLLVVLEHDTGITTNVDFYLSRARENDNHPETIRIAKALLSIR